MWLQLFAMHSYMDANIFERLRKKMLRLANSEEVHLLTEMSANAFKSDIEYGGADLNIGPIGFNSFEWHNEHQKNGNLYTFLVNQKIVGGAVLIERKEDVFIARIFIDESCFRKGYATRLMKEIEELFSNIGVFIVDTPVWNERTNPLYKKCGYIEIGIEETPDFDLIVYKKDCR